MDRVEIILQKDSKYSDMYLFIKKRNEKILSELKEKLISDVSDKKLQKILGFVANYL
jgi:hypothetical protein